MSSMNITITAEDSQARATLAKVDKELKATSTKTDQVEAHSRLTINNILFGLRAVSDMAALYSAATGEQVDTQLFALISMGLSQVMMLQAQAAVYAVTPGMQPLAMAMIAMIPMVTGVIMYAKAQSAKVEASLVAQEQAWMNGIGDF